MNNIFFVSDSHFYHANVIQYSNRPFSSVEEMNEALIQNWNAMVRPQDIVWHLGDFAFCPFPALETILGRLYGKINLVLGNHDKLIRKKSKQLLATGLFESIQDYKEIEIKKTKIVLHHYAQRVWNKSHYGSFHLFAHSHGTLPPHGLSVDVGVDSKEITEDYRPIHFEEVFYYMKNRQPAIVDHHGTRDFDKEILASGNIDNEY